MFGAGGRQIKVCQDILVDKLGANLAIFLLVKQDTAKHAIAIEPVSVSAKVVVGDWVTTITDVLASGKFDWNCSMKRTWRQRERLMNWREVA